MKSREPERWVPRSGTVEVKSNEGVTARRVFGFWAAVSRAITDSTRECPGCRAELMAALERVGLAWGSEKMIETLQRTMYRDEDGEP